jgi:PAS domain S-box-containing protein
LPVGDNEEMAHADRRREPQPAQSPAEILERMPALVVLGRIPVPTLAITSDGSILVANPAAAEMLGYSAEALLSMKFHEVFRTPIAGSAISALQAHAGQIVELAHADGSTVRAKMSGSALLRGDDPAALVTFQDFTEELWAEEL